MKYLLQAFSEGRYARQCGADPHSCPHTLPVMRAAWLRGFKSRPDDQRGKAAWSQQQLGAELVKRQRRA